MFLNKSIENQPNLIFSPIIIFLIFRPEEIILLISVPNVELVPVHQIVPANGMKSLPSIFSKLNFKPWINSDAHKIIIHKFNLVHVLFIAQIIIASAPSINHDFNRAISESAPTCTPIISYYQLLPLLSIFHNDPSIDCIVIGGSPLSGSGLRSSKVGISLSFDHLKSVLICIEDPFRV